MTDSFIDRARYLSREADLAGKRGDWDTWLLLAGIASLVADTGLLAYKEGLTTAYRSIRGAA